jgi:hypothetical protein
VRRPVAILLVALLTLLSALEAAATAAPRPWRPDVRAARSYVHHRRGIIAYAVRTEHHLWAYHGGRTQPCASVFKAMALVTYLDHPKVRGRALNAHDRSLLYPMITRSSDHATDQVVRYVGFGRVRALARRVGMRRFKTNPIWGRSHVDAFDQTKFWLHIDRFTVPRHRAYALHLLASVIRPQRWGIAQVRPKGWKLYFKSGWGLGTGWVDHQAALLTRGKERVAITILTHLDGSHPYGKATLRGLAARLLRGLDRAPVVR